MTDVGGAWLGIGAGLDVGGVVRFLDLWFFVITVVLILKNLQKPEPSPKE